MKYIKNKTIFSLLLLSMLFYVGTPYAMFGAVITFQTPKVASASSVKQLDSTKSITYYYSGGTLMNAEDDNGNMSSYLNRTVRTIINVDKKLLVDSQCLFTDGKNVISETDNSGINITSTQQYNAFGQPVNYNPDKNPPPSSVLLPIPSNMTVTIMILNQVSITSMPDITLQRLCSS